MQCLLFTYDKAVRETPLNVNKTFLVEIYGISSRIEYI